MDYSEKFKKLRPIALFFGVITLFIFLVSFTVFYTTENFSSACGCQLPIWVIIVVISSLSLFVGFTTYYLLSGYFIQDNKEMQKKVFNVLRFFNAEEQRILKKLIDKKGEANQSFLSKELKIDKVKISRIISKMEDKNMVIKEKNKMTNKIFLHNDLKKLFLNE